MASLVARSSAKTGALKSATQAAKSVLSPVRFPSMMGFERSIASCDEIRPLSIGIVPAAGTSNPILLQNEQEASVIFDALAEGSNTRYGWKAV
jgi:hypothetical protein